MIPVPGALVAHHLFPQQGLDLGRPAALPAVHVVGVADLEGVVLQVTDGGGHRRVQLQRAVAVVTEADGVLDLPAGHVGHAAVLTEALVVGGVSQVHAHVLEAAEGCAGLQFRGDAVLGVQLALHSDLLVLVLGVGGDSHVAPVTILADRDAGRTRRSGQSVGGHAGGAEGVDATVKAVVRFHGVATAVVPGHGDVHVVGQVARVLHGQRGVLGEGRGEGSGHVHVVPLSLLADRNGHLLGLAVQLVGEGGAGAEVGLGYLHRALALHLLGPVLPAHCGLHVAMSVADVHGRLDVPREGGIERRGGFQAVGGDFVLQIALDLLVAVRNKSRAPEVVGVSALVEISLDIFQSFQGRSQREGAGSGVAILELSVSGHGLLHELHLGVAGEVIQVTVVAHGQLALLELAEGGLDDQVASHAAIPLQAEGAFDDLVRQVLHLTVRVDRRAVPLVFDGQPEAVVALDGGLGVEREDDGHVRGVEGCEGVDLARVVLGLQAALAALSCALAVGGQLHVAEVSVRGVDPQLGRQVVVQPPFQGAAVLAYDRLHGEVGGGVKVGTVAGDLVPGVQRREVIQRSVYLDTSQGEGVGADPHLSVVVLANTVVHVGLEEQVLPFPLAGSGDGDGPGGTDGSGDTHGALYVRVSALGEGDVARDDALRRRLQLHVSGDWVGPVFGRQAAGLVLHEGIGQREVAADVPTTDLVVEVRGCLLLAVVDEDGAVTAVAVAHVVLQGQAEVTQGFPWRPDAEGAVHSVVVDISELLAASQLHLWVNKTALLCNQGPLTTW